MKKSLEIARILAAEKALRGEVAEPEPIAEDEPD